MAKSPRPKPIHPRDLLNTGSTLLNLALTGSIRGGWVAGQYHFFVGDSSSGKTFLALAALAEACYNKRFDQHALVYDNSEDGALMELSRFFGPRLAARLEAPAYRDEVEVHSLTVEDFYFHAYNRMKAGPCIYIIDSMDALSSEAEAKKFKARKTAMAKGPSAVAQLKGDMMDGKAKKNSAYIRQIRPLLRDTGSILIVISQTRDNIDSFSLETKTRAGGHALKFYAASEVWTKRKGTHTASYGEMKLQTGIVAEVAIKKNRLSGKEWKIEIPIYHTYGVDDTGSMVDFLVKVKHWAKADSGMITATDFELKGYRDKLVAKLEEGEHVPTLRTLVARVWREMEEHVAIKRQPRYT